MDETEPRHEPPDLPAAFRESEERLRLIQAAGQIGSFDLDMRTGRVFRSPEYLALQGLPPDTSVDGRFSDDWLDRVHPDDRDQVQAWVSADMSAPCAFSREYRIIPPDTGEVRWIHNRGRVTGDADGRPVRLISAQTDITDRKLGELRSAYMARLSEALQHAGSAREAMQAASEHLGRYLGASQVGYGEVDDREIWFDVWNDWVADDRASFAGRYRLADFGPEILARFKAGQPLVIEDLSNDAFQRRAGSLAAIRDLGVVATLGVPLMRGGKLVGFLGVHHGHPRHWSAQDVTIAGITAERTRDAVERARAEQALQQSEERMRLAIAGTGLGNYDLDMATGDGVWSETAFRLLGVAPVPGGRANYRMWSSTIHPADRTTVERVHADAEARGGAWQMENRIVRADDGRVRWLHTYGQFLGDQGARRSIGVVVDITERKETELRQAFMLRVSDRLRSADDTHGATRAIAEMLAGTLGVDTVGFAQIEADGTMATLLSGFTERAPPAWRTVRLGREHGPLRGAAIADLIQGRTFVLSDVHADPRTADRAADIVAAAGAVAAIHTPLMRDGQIGAVLFVHSAEARRWTENEVRLVEDVATRIWEAVERVRAEQALRLANEKLAQDIAIAVGEREAALAQLHQAQKLETIGQLTGGIAHDFNNLLTPITGALDMLHHRFAADERLSRWIGGALQSAERARILVQRLLGFARRQPLRPVAADLATLLDGMRDLIASSVGRGVETRIAAEPGLPAALVDVNQLELAILNLCVNARDAMPDGGSLDIGATLERAPAQLDLPDVRHVRLSVRDTGFGMNADIARRAVEPFFTTKPMERGTGLGLSMVHGLAGQLGGALALESAPGQGTRIDLWLPVAPAGAPAARAPIPIALALAPMRPLAILLVDDEDLVRASTAEMLRDLGHGVTAVASGQSALDALASDDYFDAVLTDYMMPAMDGVELATRIGAVAPGLPLLLITGFVGPDDRAAHLSRLAKPFGRNDLTAALAGLFQDAPIPH